MKKTMLFKSAILSLALMVSGLSFTSCGDDDPVVTPEEQPGETTPEEKPDENPDETKVPSKVVANYQIELSDTWYQNFDITVTYTEANEVKTAVVTENWKQSLPSSFEESANEFIMKVVATPKADVKLDPATSYQTSISALLEVFDADGNAVEGYNFFKKQLVGTKTFSENEIAELKEEVLFDYTQKLKE